MLFLRRARIRHLVGAAGVIAAGTLLGLGATAGSYAYLDSKTPVGTAATVTAGTAALSVSGQAPSLTGLYPGRTQVAVVTVTNTGGVPLDLRVDGLAGPAPATALSAALGVRVVAVSSATNCTPSLGGGWAGALSSSTSGSIGATVAAGAQQQLCIAVTLANSVASGAQGQTAGFTLTLGGRQS